MKLISVNGNDNQLLKDIKSIKHLDNQEFKILKFKDGEYCPKIDVSIRNEDIAILSQIKNSDDIMKTLLTIDAVKSSGSKSITLVLPFMPYVRQDKQDYERASIGSRLISKMIASCGIDNIISIDLHSTSIVSLYSMPFIHLSANDLFKSYITQLNIDDICIASPDEGGVKRANKFKNKIECDNFVMLTKIRKSANEVDSMNLIGDVTNKNVIIVDDMIDTGGTICMASDILYKNGAKSVRCLVTHALLNGDAITNLNNSKITEFIYTDTFISDTSNLKIKHTKLSVAKLIENKLKEINN